MIPNCFIPDLRRKGVSWTKDDGVVYLMRCAATGLCKVGASVSPRFRYSMLRSHGRKQGMHLAFAWSITTNEIGTLERYWVDRWRQYRAGVREWFRLPTVEVAAFKAVSIVNWKSSPPVSDELQHWYKQYPPANSVLRCGPRCLHHHSRECPHRRSQVIPSGLAS
jgi:hypothetical protein